MPGERQDGIYHTIADGECVLRLAFEHGLAVDTVWNHPENADLKQLRKDPNVLMRGDVLFIPDATPGSEDCATEAHHKFQRKGVPAVFRLRLLEANEPRANVKYTLIIDEDTRKTGQTDKNGMIVQTISPGARRGVLIVGEGESTQTYEVVLAGLDPVTEEVGVRERLVNLGYHIDEEVEDALTLAIAQFQSARGLDPTGEPDDRTRDELLKAHGS